MKTRNTKTKNAVRLGILLLAVLIAAAVTALPAMSAGPSVAAAAEHEVVGGNYFLSDYDTAAEVVEAGKEFNTELVSEGTVLLKNEDNALPLVSEKKLSLFGKNLYAKMAGLPGALRNAGFEINGALTNFYNDNDLTGPGAPGHPGNGVVVNGLPTGEADITKFDDTTGSVAAYNDAAVVAFYRTSGEGFDLPRTMGQVNGNYKEFGPGITPVEGARAVDDHQLQLDKNEAALLGYCADRFEKVIVIVNSPAPLELGFLDDPDHYAYHEQIKGALWTDAFNGESWPAIAQILTGEVNPSGHLPDTYARDFKADPSWNNFGNNFMEDYTDGGGAVLAKGNQYANDNMHGGGGNGGGGYYSNYVYYKEGIYSAYRYWETRGFTEGLTNKWTGETTDTLPRYAHGPDEAVHYYSKLSADKDRQETLDLKEWDNWYDAHVVYPFGHGLSYTAFDWELTDDSAGGALAADSEITATVKVTNTGAVAGKDVVQMYYSAPYDDAAATAIEKAHIQLGAFAKTSLLEPGDSETLTLTFKARDMASYDYSDANQNTFKGYELEAGAYNVYIGKNAHCWADPAVLTKTYTLAEDLRFDTDEAGKSVDETKGKIKNRFDEISNQLLHEDRYPEDENNNEKDKYMTRADWTGTYPTMSYRLTAEQWIIDGLKEYNDVAEAPFGSVDPADKPTDPWYNDEMPKLGQKYDTPIKLKQLFGLDYDDPLWDTFLDQLTVAQIRDLALRGHYKSGISIPELGVTQIENRDGPTCVLIPDADGNVYLPNDILTAATWNVDIAYRRGKLLGNISLWGGGGGNISARVPGWYAPAVNIHRSPFGGRVGEYLSEDGLLAGRISAQIVRGAREMGMWCYVKHFTLNEQETNRCGLLTWADEQAMREVYFKPFEICVKEGKTLGIMSSLNRFGPRWAGGDYELLTGVLRDEWGFRGNVVTDSFASWSNSDCMIRAGGSLALGNGPALRVAPESATTINCLRNCAHDVLYTHANSMAINEGETPTVPRKIRGFVAKTLEIGMVNTDYEQSIAGCLLLNTQYYPDLDPAKATFALSDTSKLPDGLNLSPDGVVSGRPTVEARLSFTVVATYEDETRSQTFTVQIVGEGGAIIWNADENVLNAQIGVPFNGDAAKAYIYDPYAEDTSSFPDVTYAVANGSALPDGLTLKSDGTIVGICVKECRNYSFSVVASALGYRDTDFEFTISVLYPLTYGSKSLESGSYGKSYFAAINTAVSDASVTYALKEGSSLPKGLKLSPGGCIVGVPEEACAKTFTVIAFAKFASPVEAVYSLTVNPAFDSTTALPFGKLGEAYVGSAGTAQGSFNITYKIIGGGLPAGLTMASDGSISGTPGAPGTYTIIVRAQDGELAEEIALNLFVANTDAGAGGAVTDASKPAAITLGVTTGVFAAGFAVMTVLFVLTKKKKK